MDELINKVHLGDMLETIKLIPDESIDLIVSDIPYLLVAGGVSIKKGTKQPKGILGRQAVSDGSRQGDKWIKKDGSVPCAVAKGKMFEFNGIKFHEYLPSLYRVLKKGTHCYLMINGRNLAELQIEAEKAGFVFQNLLVWNKGNATPNCFYMQSAEFILMLSKRPARHINERGSKSVITIPNIIGKKVHPSEKPVELMQLLIKNSSNRGDLVLDPFMGSGTTANACINLKRNFIGMEIDTKYYEISKDRIKRAYGRGGLFA